MILESTDLTPTAIEWRTTLFSLGKLLYETAETARKADQAVLSGDAAGSDLQAAALARFDDAILRLEEFATGTRRRGDRRGAVPSGAALAAQRQSPEARWKTAETDIARSEFRRQMQERLERAIRELQGLQTLLVNRQASGQLDPPGQVMLRNCFFEIANCYFLLGRYEAAIAAYSSGAGRYQHEPDSLTAYVQIANCYDRLQKPAEALSTLAQAQLILKQLPESVFTGEPSAMSRDDWQRWLDWAMKLHN